MHRAIWLAKECWDASIATDQNEQVTIAEKWMWCFHRSDPPISVCIRDSLWSTLKDKTTYITKIMPRYPTSPCGGEIPFCFARFLTSNVGHLLLRSTELLSSDVRELAEPAEDWCHNHVESNSDSTRKPRERGGRRRTKAWNCYKLSDVQNELTSLWTSLSSLVVCVGFWSFCIAFKCLQDWKKPSFVCLLSCHNVSMM